MHYVIIGNSAAGCAAAGEIRKHDHDGRITMISKDTCFYSRCQLHLVVAGKRSLEAANFLLPGWAEETGVELQLNTVAETIDPEKRLVSLSGKQTLPYDRLLIATGARGASLPIKGLHGKGVFGLRDLADAQTLRQALARPCQVVVVGAGLVGCELAAELAEIGHQVHLVEIATHPLPLQLEEKTGALCAEQLESAGVVLHCGIAVDLIERDDDGEVAGVLLRSGTGLKADMVVITAGVLPNSEIAAEAGIAVDTAGILIDASCKTSDPNIYAAGDVTLMEDVLLRQLTPSMIWPTAVRQGRVAGANMACQNASLGHNTGLRTVVSIKGTPIVSLGPVSRPEPTWKKSVNEYTNSHGQRCMRVLYTQGNILKAAILWRDIVDAGVFAESIINQVELPVATDRVGWLDGAKRGAVTRSIL